MGTVSFALQGRVAVVTGAAQGIGEACARRLARDGASVALWDVDVAKAQALASEIGAAGVKTFVQRCNVSRKAEVDAALAATLQALGPVDALVNNAGIFKAADFLDITEADWDAVIDVNLKGSFLVAQAVARVMALGLADHGIRVNAVGPGTIATELARAAVLDSEEAKARILSRTPLRRLGEPAEVADAVAFLLSDAASYITGEIVYVDGGRRALNYTVPPRA